MSYCGLLTVEDLKLIFPSLPTPIGHGTYTDDIIIIFAFGCISVKHEYEGEWNGKHRLLTCDPHTKRTVINSNSPQEVEAGQEIVFTYDVEYQVGCWTSNLK